jgi:hypothetical protein
VLNQTPARARVAGKLSNPGGKFTSIKAMIAENGPQIVQNLIDIATGAAVETYIGMDGEERAKGVRASDQIKASELCLSYWLGKPKGDGDDDHREESQALDLGRLTSDELRTMLELTRKAKGLP